jgi:hypothetical protein
MYSHPQLVCYLSPLTIFLVHCDQRSIFYTPKPRLQMSNGANYQTFISLFTRLAPTQRKGIARSRLYTTTKALAVLNRRECSSQRTRKTVQYSTHCVSRRREIHNCALDFTHHVDTVGDALRTNTAITQPLITKKVEHFHKGCAQERANILSTHSHPSTSMSSPSVSYVQSHSRYTWPCNYTSRSSKSEEPYLEREVVGSTTRSTVYLNCSRFHGVTYHDSFVKTLCENATLAA